MVRYTKSVLASVVLIGSLFGSHNANATLISSSETFSTRTTAVTSDSRVPITFRNSTSATTTFSGFDSSIGILESVSIMYDTLMVVRGEIRVFDPSSGFFQEDNVQGFGRAENTSFIDLFSPNLGGTPFRTISTGLACSDDDGRCVQRGASRFSGFDGILFSSTDENVLRQFTDRLVGIRSTNIATASVTRCDDFEDTCRVTAVSSFSGTYTLNFTYRDLPQAVSSPGALTLMLLGVLIAGMRRKSS